MKKVIICSLFLMSVSMIGCNKDKGNEQVRNTTVMNTQTVDDILASNIEEEQTNEVYTVSEDSIETSNGVTNNEAVVSAMINNSTGETTARIVEESSYKNIDYDLSTMSSTLVYSEVYNMMTDVTPYMDKVVKIKGYVSIFKDDTTGKVYYSCIVPDATACCSNGIEFILNDTYKQYEDYPLDNEEITVVGVFTTYLEDNINYFTLKDAELVK